MGIFGRRKAEPPADGSAAIRAFWAWWSGSGALSTAAALAEGEPEQVAGGISGRVHAIDADLAWELGPGIASEHVLVVTAAGDPALRPVARRWRMAAPAADATWEYSDVRLPSPDLDEVVLDVDGFRVDATRAVATARIEGTALDVCVHHPAFAEMTEEAGTMTTLLLLDALLGEAAVETWLGQISASTLAPLDAFPLGGLRPVLRDLQDRHTGADGQPDWVILQGSAPDGTPLLASAQVPLRPATAPHLDTYVAVLVPYTDRTPEGFPGPGSLQALRDLEDHLGQRLGGSGKVLAHQTHGGVRVLHLYVDGTTPAAAQVRAAVAGWDQGAVEIQTRADPGWDGVAHLRG